MPNGNTTMASSTKEFDTIRSRPFPDGMRSLPSKVYDDDTTTTFLEMIQFSLITITDINSFFSLNLTSNKNGHDLF